MRRWMRLIFNTLRFPYGYLRFRVYAKTDPWAHQALVQLFCDSGGRALDLFSFLIGLTSKKINFIESDGVLGPLNEVELKKYSAILKSQGYLVFPNALKVDMCERLLEYAYRTPALLRKMDYENADGPPRYEIFNQKNLSATRYEYPSDGLLAHEDFQLLMSDLSLLKLAQEYLGSKPIFDVFGMWWHTNFQSGPDSEAAQYYHFDLDRIKWLKIFIYLTDVGENNGPHTFVEGSHRSGSIPHSMLKQGYARINDDQVIAHYGASKQIEFLASRGTIIIEDTRGLHKGKAVSEDRSRLILQLQFSNSLFGAECQKAKIPHQRVSKLQEAIDISRDVYASFL